MEVLLVAEQLRRAAPGGIGTYTQGLVHGLATLDGARQPALLASRARVRPDPLARLGSGVRTVPLPGPLVTRAWDRGWLPAPAGFDVVHAPSLAFPRPRQGVPLVVAVHDVAWQLLPDAFPRRGRRWHEAALRRAAREATRVVVPSPETADAVRAAGAPPASVAVLDPMYGADHLPPADHLAAAELLGGLGVRGPYLLTVGTLEPRKNAARLLQAYTAARSQLPEPWPLVVVGPLGWGERIDPVPGVVLAGAVPAPALAALYAGARCVVYVPLFEGFGLPAVEAMAACTPVVASPMPSTGGAALEVDPLAVDSIAAGIAAAAGDEARRAELVTAGLLRAQELTWEAAAASHVALWEELP